MNFKKTFYVIAVLSLFTSSVLIAQTRKQSTTQKPTQTVEIKEKTDSTKTPPTPTKNIFNGTLATPEVVETPTSEPASAVAQQDWKEKDEFHKVISSTFHPIEKGDFKPIKARSGELAKAAKNWAKSDIPKAFTEKNTKGEITNALNNLVKETSELSLKIKAKASNEEIKKRMISIHEIFHSIVEKCQHEEEEKK